MHWKVHDYRCRYSVGDIVAKVNNPHDYEYLLLCDGSTFDKTKYPELAKIFTSGTLPNLTDGRFLEGGTTIGETRNAGLPDIAGYFNLNNGSLFVGNGYGDGFSGPFTAGAIIQNVSGGTTNIGTQMTGLWFSASKANSIYGSSYTVQPKSYVVKYYVCYGG